MAKIFSKSGEEAEVSDCDFELVSQFKWYSHQRGAGSKKYFTTTISRKTTYLHRLIMNPPTGFEVDHINNDTLDNRRENLRLATRAQNCCNRRDYAPSSGFRGVYKAPKASTWQARLYYCGERINAGNYPTKEEAARSYDKLAKQYFGEFAVLNFPGEQQ